MAVAVTAARAALAGVVEQPLWSLDAAATRHLLLDLTALVSQVAELEGRALVQADAVAVHEESGATSVATWLVHATRMTHREAHAKVRLAKLLAAHERDPRRRRARGGACRPGPSRRGRRRCPSGPARPTRPGGKHLPGEARHFNAVDLRRLGKRVLDVVDPGAGEAAEAVALAREEREAAAATRLTMSDDGHGRTHGRFTLPTAQAAMLRKMLLAIAAPKHQRASGTEPFVPGRPSAERMGRAFCELIERYPADRLPKVGGLNCTVVVTMTLESLLGGLELPRSTPVSGSPPPRPAGSPARRASFLPSSARPVGCSTSAGPPGSPPSRSGWHLRSSSARASTPRARCPAGCATSTTPRHGRREVAPTGATRNCCVPDTTPSPTATRRAHRYGREGVLHRLSTTLCPRPRREDKVEGSLSRERGAPMLQRAWCTIVALLLGEVLLGCDDEPEPKIADPTGVPSTSEPTRSRLAQPDTRADEPGADSPGVGRGRQRSHPNRRLLRLRHDHRPQLHDL